MSRSTSVIGVFTTRERADRAVHELRRAGFRGGQIKIAFREKNDAAEGAKARVKRGTRTTESTAAAAVRDMVAQQQRARLGARPSAEESGKAANHTVDGLLDSVRRVAAAAADSVTSTLASIGFLEGGDAFYESEFLAGRTLVAVRVRRRGEEAAAILRRCGGYDAHGQPSSTERTSQPPAAGGPSLAVNASAPGT
jgi:hypothetical protein